MFSNKQLIDTLKQSLLHAVKPPLPFFILGIISLALSDINILFSLTNQKNIFFYLDKLGDILITFAMLLFIYKLIVSLFRGYEKVLNERNSVAALIAVNVRKSFQIIFILVTLDIIIIQIGPVRGYLILADHLLSTLIIASIGWITIQILSTVEAIVYQKMIRLEQKHYLYTKGFYTKVHIIKNIATVIIIFITVAAILMSFNSVRSIGISLLASAGFITAIVGLAAQKPLSALFSGLQIAVAQPIKIGDMVSVDKKSGTIEEITFTYVRLKLNNDRRLLVPITYFIENVFENWSHSSSFSDSILLYVHYTTPIEPIRTELDRILKSSSLWDGKIGRLQVSSLTAQTIELSLVVSATQTTQLSDLCAEIREKILEFIREHYRHALPD